MPPPRSLNDDGAARAQVRSRDATLTLPHELLNPFHLFHLPAEPASHLLHLSPECECMCVCRCQREVHKRVRQVPTTEIQFSLLEFGTRTCILPFTTVQISTIAVPQCMYVQQCGPANNRQIPTWHLLYLEEHTGYFNMNSVNILPSSSVLSFFLCCWV